MHPAALICSAACSSRLQQCKWYVMLDLPLISACSDRHTTLLPLVAGWYLPISCKMVSVLGAILQFLALLTVVGVEQLDIADMRVDRIPTLTL